MKTANNPLISIIVPMYNSSFYLKQCLDSLISQTYSNIEIIVVDGGSSDNSLHICKQNYTQIPYFFLFVCEKGVSKQRNLGIEKSKGDFIYFMDSDDFLENDTIENLYTYLINNKLDIVSPKVIKELYDGNLLIKTTVLNYKINKEISSDMFFEPGHLSFLHQPNKLYKKSIISSTRFNDKLIMAQDSFFNYELSKRTFKFDVCENAIYHYRILTTQNQASKRLRKETLYYFKHMMKTIKSLPKKSQSYYGAISMLEENFLLFSYEYYKLKKPLPFILFKAKMFLFFKKKKKEKKYLALYLYFKSQKECLRV